MNLHNLLRAMLVLVLALLFLSACSAAAPDASMSITSAVNKNKQAQSYRIDVKTTIIDEAGKTYPSDSIYEVSGKDYHATITGDAASQWIGEPNKTFEYEVVTGKVYIHGPIPSLAPEDKWSLSENPIAKGFADAPPMQEIDMMAFDLGGAQKLDTESLDNQSCDVYTRTKTATVRSYWELKGASPAQLAQLTQDVLDVFDVADTKFFVCSDGYLHQVTMDVSSHQKSEPWLKYEFASRLHFDDVNQNIEITAPPADAP
jgi:hypothetical protein